MSKKIRVGWDDLKPGDLMKFFSPQTRYFNAGLGRTEVYIW